jgi:hypothetical protein
MVITSSPAAMHTRQNSAMLSKTHSQDSSKSLHHFLVSPTPLTPSPSKHPNLLQMTSLQKRAANVGMHLLASYLCTNAHTLAQFLAIDVTIIAPPTPLNGASQSVTTTTTQHHKAKWKTFMVNGSHTSIRVLEGKILSNNISFSFHSLLTTLVTLAPLHIASSFVLTDTKLRTLHLPQYLNEMDKFTTQWTSYGPSSPIDLICQADKNWTNTHPYTQYRPSYHTTLPSHWAQQFLGLNLLHLPPHLASKQQETTYKEAALHKLQAIQQ